MSQGVDSALFAAETLSVRSEVKWLTWVPTTLTEAKAFLADAPASALIPAERSGYFYYETAVTYAEIEQRWLVVVYEPSRQQALTRLERSVALFILLAGDFAATHCCERLHK
jgi:hypothetical protein